jgi:hypothetical protein
MPQAAEVIDAHDFDWIFEVSDIFSLLPVYIYSHEKEQQDFLQWHYASLPVDQPPENIVFGEYSDRETTPAEAGRQTSQSASKRSNVSSPTSETGDSSSKKSSAAYIVSEIYKIIFENIPNIFTEKTVSKPHSSTCISSSAKRPHGSFRTETPKHAHRI